MHLILILGKPLLLETKLLILQGLFSFGADSELGKFIHGAVVFLLDILKFGLERCLFGSIVISQLFQLLLLILDLVGETLLLVFDRKDGAISFGDFGSDLFEFLVELTSFLVEFLQLEIVLFARAILQIIIAFLKFS